ncbi:hypothetical protein O1611_g4631 [Lasiodiplodia mahajangana]|uniref:Uncharacterized protein n=1 Tax=Lasiodiplodia mahajangana TaxID=1108764 RepID=A0ACC2JP29_9PEZI|nr:hypothetical protein O1611_g4631 [Lasiodiplodia mahajangana]
MASHFPSIQSFYSREIASNAGNDSSNFATAGDGFTPSEVKAVINPLARPFQPSRRYDVCPIIDIQTGPHNYKITGRLVNFSTTGGSYTTPSGAEGYYFLVICDGTAAIAIKLYCSASKYQPLLGQRITVWATSICTGNRAEIQHIPYCSVATTIYPARNRETHIEFHTDEAGSEDDLSLRCPLEASIQHYDYLPGLMTLKSFLASGYDLSEGKILVCVRSVGPRQIIHPMKRKGTLDLVEVRVYDDTAHCVLKLWEDKIPSAKSWVPNQTVLLISQPWCQDNNRNNSRQGDTHASIGIGYSSIIDVDPVFPDAIWLRTKIQDMAKKESVIIPFPSATWDLELAMYGPGRVLYTLAELEDQVRNQNPDTNFTGKLSVVVLEMNLMDHWRKNTTCCTDCCGIPLYANKPVATCKHCGMLRDLSVNPRILSSFLDESGMIAGSRLVWNDTAWTQLFFGTAIERTPTVDRQHDAAEKSWRAITALDTPALRDLEAQLLYSRVTLTFGWSVELRRLCILGAEW